MDNPSSVVPSDYGAARGICALQYFVCCCFTYCPIWQMDGRTFKYYAKARERILHEQNCPLFILDNSSIQEYICKERSMNESKSLPGSAASTAANSPRSLCDGASGDEGLLCSRMAYKWSSSVDGIYYGYRSHTDDYERSEPVFGSIFPSNADEDTKPSSTKPSSGFQPVEIGYPMHTPTNGSATFQFNKV